MSENCPSNELLAIAAQLADGELNESERDRLRALVAESRANAVWFMDWMEVNAMLHLDFAGRDPGMLVPHPLSTQQALHSGACDLGDTGRSSTLKSVTRNRTAIDILRTNGWVAIATCLLVGLSYLLGVLTAGFGNLGSKSSTLVSPPLIQDRFAEVVAPIATISGGVDAVFRDGFALGSRLEPGIVRLERGIAQIAFDSGAIIVIEGPAELELVDASTCRLLNGSLSADVLPEATGFSVAAGGIKISEHDAQFGLRTGPENETEVHAFGGRLNLVDFRGPVGQARQLEAGEAIRWQAGSTAAGISPDPASFITRRELARRQRLSEQRAYARWIDYSKRWLDDPAVVLRYEFGPSVDGEIINTVDAGMHSATSRQASPRWVAGRWSDKRAMLFDGRTDVLDVADHPDLRLKGDLSFAVWVRVRSFSQAAWTRLAGKGFGPDRNFGLWMGTNGDFYWQVCPDRDPESQEVWDRHSTLSGKCPPSEWLLVVGVVDGAVSKVYVNGELHNSCPAPKDIATSNDPLTIGFYDRVPGHDEYFCGELDELILLNRALTAEEIHEMYEAGKPQYALPPGELDALPQREAELKASI